MINVNYEIYHNDFNRRYENKSFRDLGEFKDWMFGLMHQPYVSERKLPNMFFVDGVVKGKLPLDSSSRISIRPEWGGAHYLVHCVSDGNKVVFSNGKYTNGQCYISEGFKAFMQECMDKRDGKEQSFEFGEIEGYAPPVVRSVGEQAAELVAQNPNFARAVYFAVQRQYDREDIEKRIGKSDLFAKMTFSESEIDEIAERFNDRLGGEDDYWATYWDVADAVIEAFVEEKGKTVDAKSLFVVPKDVCDGIVDTALRAIRGFGIDQGSGDYVLNSFEIDGEKLNLCVDIMKGRDEEYQQDYFAVYYAVEYDGGLNLFSGWKDFDSLDVDELKKVVCEIANTDFTEDIRKVMHKELDGSLEKKVRDAEGSRMVPEKRDNLPERGER